MNKKTFLLEATAYPNVLWKVDMENGNPKLYSLRGAIKAAFNWIRYADTVGGQARILDAATKKVVWR